jgi:TetR/AcrR family transcriptional repressor of nem operon
VTRTDARARRKLATREAIVRAAGRSLREHGIEASTVADVMKSAGLTVGGFYAHFRSKEAMLIEAMRATGRDLWDRVLDANRDKSPLEQAEAAVSEYLSELHRDKPGIGCLMPSTGPEVAREGEPYRSAFGRGLSTLADELAALLGGGNDARRRALGVIALMYGGLSLARSVGKGPLSSSILEAARDAALEQIRGCGGESGSRRVPPHRHR